MGYHKGEDTLMEGAVEMYQWERQIQSIVDELSLIHISEPTRP